MQSSDKRFYIWDSSAKPNPKKNCSYIFWNETFKVDASFISIVDILESNSDKLKLRYLEFIYALGKSKIGNTSIIDYLEIRENCSYWWMTLLQEKSNWAKSPQISNIIKVMALELFLDKSPCNKISINSDNQNLIDSLRIYCVERKIDFEDLNQKKFMKKKLLLQNQIMIPFNFIKAFSWLIREILFSIPFTFLGYSQWRLSSPKNIFVTYLSSNQVQTGLREFNSSFWGPLPDYLVHKKIPSNWLYLPSRRFNLLSTFNTFKKIKKEKDSTQNYIILSSFFNINVLLKSLKDISFILKRSFKARQALKESSNIYWPLINSDINKSLFGIEMVSSVFHLSLFESASLRSSNDAQIIYLAENQPWEMALLTSLRSRNNRLIGFAHSTIRYWDLRYFNDSRNFKASGLSAMPLPDCLAVNGIKDKLTMINYSYPSEMIMEVESLRYIYLNDVVGCPNKKNKRKKMLLVLGDFLKTDTMFMLSFLKSQDIKKYLKDVDIVIKPHPACALEKKDLKGINASLDHSDLGSLLATADIVFTGNVTSAAVEAYCLGKKILSARNLKGLDMSPLRGENDVRFVHDDDSFKTSLKMLLDKSIKIENKDFFRLNSNMEKWKQLLNL